MDLQKVDCDRSPESAGETNPSLERLARKDKIDNLLQQTAEQHRENNLKLKSAMSAVSDDPTARDVLSVDTKDPKERAEQRKNQIAASEHPLIKNLAEALAAYKSSKTELAALTTEQTELAEALFGARKEERSIGELEPADILSPTQSIFLEMNFDRFRDELRTMSNTNLQALQQHLIEAAFAQPTSSEVFSKLDTATAWLILKNAAEPIEAIQAMQFFDKERDAQNPALGIKDDAQASRLYSSALFLLKPEERRELYVRLAETKESAYQSRKNRRKGGEPRTTASGLSAIQQDLTGLFPKESFSSYELKELLALRTKAIRKTDENPDLLRNLRVTAQLREARINALYLETPEKAPLINASYEAARTARINENRPAIGLDHRQHDLAERIADLPSADLQVYRRYLVKLAEKNEQLHTFERNKCDPSEWPRLEDKYQRQEERIAAAESSVVNTLLDREGWGELLYNTEQFTAELESVPQEKLRDIYFYLRDKKQKDQQNNLDQETPLRQFTQSYLTAKDLLLREFLIRTNPQQTLHFLEQSPQSLVEALQETSTASALILISHLSSERERVRNFFGIALGGDNEMLAPFGTIVAEISEQLAERAVLDSEAVAEIETSVAALRVEQAETIEQREQLSGYFDPAWQQKNDRVGEIFEEIEPYRIYSAFRGLELEYAIAAIDATPFSSGDSDTAKALRTTRQQFVAEQRNHQKIINGRDYVSAEEEAERRQQAIELQAELEGNKQLKSPPFEVQQLLDVEGWKYECYDKYGKNTKLVQTEAGKRLGEKSGKEEKQLVSYAELDHPFDYLQYDPELLAQQPGYNKETSAWLANRLNEKQKQIWWLKEKIHNNPGSDDRIVSVSSSRLKEFGDIDSSIYTDQPRTIGHLKKILRRLRAYRINAPSRPGDGFGTAWDKYADENPTGSKLVATTTAIAGGYILAFTGGSAASAQTLRQGFTASVKTAGKRAATFAAFGSGFDLYRQSHEMIDGTRGIGEFDLGRTGKTALAAAAMSVPISLYPKVLLPLMGTASATSAMNELGKGNYATAKVDAEAAALMFLAPTKLFGKSNTTNAAKSSSKSQPVAEVQPAPKNLAAEYNIKVDWSMPKGPAARGGYEGSGGSGYQGGGSGRGNAPANPALDPFPGRGPNMTLSIGPNNLPRVKVPTSTKTPSFRGFNNRSQSGLRNQLEKQWPKYNDPARFDGIELPSVELAEPPAATAILEAPPPALPRPATSVRPSTPAKTSTPRGPQLPEAAKLDNLTFPKSPSTSKTAVSETPQLMPQTLRPGLVAPIRTPGLPSPPAELTPDEERFWRAVQEEFQVPLTKEELDELIKILHSPDGLEVTEEQMRRAAKKLMEKSSSLSRPRPLSYAPSEPGVLELEKLQTVLDSLATDPLLPGFINGMTLGGLAYIAVHGDPAYRASAINELEKHAREGNAEAAKNLALIAILTGDGKTQAMAIAALEKVLGKSTKPEALSEMLSEEQRVFVEASRERFAEVLEYRNEGGADWAEDYAEQLDAAGEELCTAAEQLLRINDVNIAQGHEAGTPIEISIHGDSPLNKYAAKVWRSKQAKVIYNPRHLFVEKAGALYDNSTNTVYLAHDAVATLTPTLNMYHERVHVVTERFRAAGAESIFFGEIEAIDRSAPMWSEAEGGYEYFFGLDEFIAHTEVLHERLKLLIAHQKSPAIEVSSQDLTRLQQELAVLNSIASASQGLFAEAANSQQIEFSDESGVLQAVLQVGNAELRLDIAAGETLAEFGKKLAEEVADDKLQQLLQISGELQEKLDPLLRFTAGLRDEETSAEQLQQLAEQIAAVREVVSPHYPWKSAARDSRFSTAHLSDAKQLARRSVEERPLEHPTGRSLRAKIHADEDKQLIIVSTDTIWHRGKYVILHNIRDMELQRESWIATEGPAHIKTGEHEVTLGYFLYDTASQRLIAGNALMGSDIARADEFEYAKSHFNDFSKVQIYVTGLASEAESALVNDINAVESEREVVLTALTKHGFDRDNIHCFWPTNEGALSIDTDSGKVTYSGDGETRTVADPFNDARSSPKSVISESAELNELAERYTAVEQKIDKLEQQLQKRSILGIGKVLAKTKLPALQAERTALQERAAQICSSRVAAEASPTLKTNLKSRVAEDRNLPTNDLEWAVDFDKKLDSRSFSDDEVIAVHISQRDYQLPKDFPPGLLLRNSAESNDAFGVLAHSHADNASIAENKGRWTPYAVRDGKHIFQQEKMSENQLALVKILALDLISIHNLTEKLPLLDKIHLDDDKPSSATDFLADLCRNSGISVVKTAIPIDKSPAADTNGKLLHHLKELVEQNGSALVEVYLGDLDVIGLIVDHIDLQHKEGARVVLRDPWHGWQITVTADAFVNRLETSLDALEVIQCYKKLGTATTEFPKVIDTERWRESRKDDKERHEDWAARELESRISRDPQLTAQEQSIGDYIESFPTFLRRTVLTLNNKGYPLLFAGFDRGNYRQTLHLACPIDSLQRVDLENLGLIVVSNGKSTTIQWPHRRGVEPKPSASKWQKIVDILPSRVLRPTELNSISDKVEFLEFYQEHLFRLYGKVRESNYPPDERSVSNVNTWGKQQREGITTFEDKHCIHRQPAAHEDGRIIERYSLNVVATPELLQELDAFASKYQLIYKIARTDEKWNSRNDPVNLYVFDSSTVQPHGLSTIAQQELAGIAAGYARTPDRLFGTRIFDAAGKEITPAIRKEEIITDTEYLTLLSRADTIDPVLGLYLRELFGFAEKTKFRNSAGAVESARLLLDKLETDFKRSSTTTPMRSPEPEPTTIYLSPVRRRQFLQAIKEDPSNNARKLDYAAWLENGGELTRSEFIKLSIEYQSLAADAPQRQELTAKLNELTKNPAAICDNVELGKILIEAKNTRLGSNYRYSGGFISELALPSKLLLKHQNAISVNLPLRKLKVTDGYMFRRDLKNLLKVPYLSGVQSLDLSDNALGKAHMKLLAKTEALSSLKVLDLSRNHIGDSGLVQLAKAEHLAELRTLKLSSNKIGEKSRGKSGAIGLKALAASQTFENLKALGLNNNRISSLGAAALANSEVLNNLQMLNLAENRIWAAGAEKLAASDTLSKLEGLDLSGNTIGDKGSKAIAASTKLSQLQTLLLSHCGIGNPGAAALSRTNNLPELNVLDLSWNNISKSGATALRDGALLPQLSRIDLSDNTNLRSGMMLPPFGNSISRKLQREIQAQLESTPPAGGTARRAPEPSEDESPVMRRQIEIREAKQELRREIEKLKGVTDRQSKLHQLVDKSSLPPGALYDALVAARDLMVDQELWKELCRITSAMEMEEQLSADVFYSNDLLELSTQYNAADSEISRLQEEMTKSSGLFGSLADIARRSQITTLEIRQAELRKKALKLVADHLKTYSLPQDSYSDGRSDRLLSDRSTPIASQLEAAAVNTGALGRQFFNDDEILAVHCSKRDWLIPETIPPGLLFHEGNEVLGTLNAIPLKQLAANQSVSRDPIDWAACTASSGKHLIQQVGPRSSLPAATMMLALDVLAEAKLKYLEMNFEVLQSNSWTEETVVQQLKSLFAGSKIEIDSYELKGRSNFEMEDEAAGKYYLNQLAKAMQQRGPSLVMFESEELDCFHALIIDEIDLEHPKGARVVIRDPWHGWRITVRAEALASRIGSSKLQVVHCNTPNEKPTTSEQQLAAAAFFFNEHLEHAAYAHGPIKGAMNELREMTLKFADDQPIEREKLEEYLLEKMRLNSDSPLIASDEQRANARMRRRQLSYALRLVEENIVNATCDSNDLLGVIIWAEKQVADLDAMLNTRIPPGFDNEQLLDKSVLVPDSAKFTPLERLDQIRDGMIVVQAVPSKGQAESTYQLCEIREIDKRNRPKHYELRRIQTVITAPGKTIDPKAEVRTLLPEKMQELLADLWVPAIRLNPPEADFSPLRSETAKALDPETAHNREVMQQIQEALASSDPEILAAMVQKAFGAEAKDALALATYNLIDRSLRPSANVSFPDVAKAFDKPELAAAWKSALSARDIQALLAGRCLWELAKGVNSRPLAYGKALKLVRPDLLATDSIINASSDMLHDLLASEDAQIRSEEIIEFIAVFYPNRRSDNPPPSEVLLDAFRNALGGHPEPDEMIAVFEILGCTAETHQALFADLLCNCLINGRYETFNAQLMEAEHPDAIRPIAFSNALTRLYRQGRYADAAALDRRFATLTDSLRDTAIQQAMAESLTDADVAAAKEISSKLGVEFDFRYLNKALLQTCNTFELDSIEKCCAFIERNDDYWIHVHYDFTIDELLPIIDKKHLQEIEKLALRFLDAAQLLRAGHDLSQLNTDGKYSELLELLPKIDSLWTPEDVEEFRALAEIVGYRQMFEAVRDVQIAEEDSLSASVDFAMRIYIAVAGEIASLVADGDIEAVEQVLAILPTNQEARIQNAIRAALPQAILNGKIEQARHWVEELDIASLAVDETPAALRSIIANMELEDLNALIDFAEQHAEYLSFVDQLYRSHRRSPRLTKEGAKKATDAGLSLIKAEKLLHFGELD